MILSIAVGSLAEWVGAAGTVGAFVATYVLLRRQVHDQRRAQARLVAAWRRVEGQESGPNSPRRSILYVRNGGDETIYSVTVTSSTGTVMGFWRVIPGGEVGNKLWTDDIDQTRIGSVTFHDAAGRAWMRDTNGILHSSKHIRVDSLDLPPAVTRAKTLDELRHQMTSTPFDGGWVLPKNDVPPGGEFDPGPKSPSA